MSLWDIQPGQWRVNMGLDTNNDQQIDVEAEEQTVYLERGSVLNLNFPPGNYSVINLELSEPAQSDYHERCDLAISASGIKINGSEVTVRVYSQGAIGSPETLLELRDASAERISTAPVPAMEAPLDLIPRWVDIVLHVPAGTDLRSGSVSVDPDKKITQITKINTEVKW